MAQLLSNHTIRRLIICHGLLICVATFLPKLMLDTFASQYRHELDDYLITFVGFAQTTLVTFWLVFGSRPRALARLLLLCVLCIVHALLLWTANSGSPFVEWTPWYVWHHFRIVFAPIPSAILIAAIAYCYGLRVRAQPNCNTRLWISLWQILGVTSIVAMILGFSQVVPWLLEAASVRVSPLWAQVSPHAYLNLDLSVWSVYSASICAILMTQCLQAESPVGRLILTLFASCAFGCIFGLMMDVFLVDYWAYYVLGSIVICGVIGGTVMGIREDGVTLVRSHTERSAI